MKSRIVATLSFWLIGGFLAWLGDKLIPSTGWIGGIMFLAGLGICCIPILYFVSLLISRRVDAPTGVFPLQNNSPKYSGLVDFGDTTRSARTTPLLSRRSHQNNGPRKPL
jgi:hypothetical protein